MSIVIPLSPSMSADHLQPPPHQHQRPHPHPPRHRPASMLSTSSSLNDMDVLSSPLVTSMLFGRESLASSGGIPIGGLQDPAALRRALRSRTASSGFGGYGGYAPPFAPGSSSPGSSSSRSPVSSRCSSSTSLATLAEEREIPPRPVSRAASSGETLVAPPMPIPLPGSSYSPPPPSTSPSSTSSPRPHRRSVVTTYTPGTRSKLSSSYSAEGGPVSSPDLLESATGASKPTKAMSTTALTSEKDKDRERSMLRRIGRTLRSLSISGRKRKSIPAFVEVAAA